MPVLDTELVQPLNAIRETLLKRPGLVTMQSIKKLSEIYGFTTFVENIKDNDGKPLIRMSISGLVLLIDIDFSIPTDMINNIETPISPGINSINGLNNNMNILSNKNIINVSISSAITPDEIEGKSWDFLFGFEGFASCSDVLFENLKQKTLDSFNMNLRVLLLFDRLSKNKPNDLFTFFSNFVWRLTKQLEFESTKENKESISKLNKLDWDDGILGIGRVLCNQNNKVGVFLQYCIDDRNINRWIEENKDISVFNHKYLIHFKVKESLKKDEDYDKIDKLNENNLNNDENNNGIIKKEDGNDIIMNESNFETNQNDNINRIDKNEIEGTLFDQKLQENLSIITMELCPPIWIPEDALKLHGIEYEIINEGNQNWSDNNKTEITDSEYNKEINNVYESINESGGYVELQKNDVDNEKIEIEMLIGCKMIRLFKMQIGDMNKLNAMIKTLRNWCLANNKLRHFVKGYHPINKNFTNGKNKSLIDNFSPADLTETNNSSVFIDENIKISSSTTATTNISQIAPSTMNVDLTDIFNISNNSQDKDKKDDYYNNSNSDNKNSNNNNNNAIKISIEWINDKTVVVIRGKYSKSGSIDGDDDMKNVDNNFINKRDELIY
jgi:hypothetical protein